MKGRLQSLVDEAQSKQDAHIRVCFGLLDGAIEECRARDQDFVYLDHAYFNRGWANKTFRAVRNDIHQTKTVKRPDDRLRKWGIEIKPWRKGRNIIVLQSSSHIKEFYNACKWEGETLLRLHKLTDRPVIYKRKLVGTLLDYLQDAHAVVSFASVGDIEAALFGVPVFCSEHSPAWPINAGPIEKIEGPKRKDRFEWACSLAYASWHESEIDSIEWRNYSYRMLPCVS